MHPALVALAASNPKKFHLGSVQLMHMTGTEGAKVIFAGFIVVAILLALWGIGVIKIGNN